jgi:aminoethylphosphonate catabolism LysR family transcriptional regulator
MRVTCTQIRAFNAVAHEGSFANAAKRLHVSQPAVTLQVRRLEDIYGVVLFDRRGSHVTLTEVGRQLFEITDQIGTLEEEVDDLLSAQYDLQSGSLTVATGSPEVTMRLVSEFQQRHSHCKITVVIGNAGENAESIFNRRADIACITEPKDDPRLVIIPFISNEVVLLVPVGHSLAREKQVRLEALATERIIVRVDKSYTQQLVARHVAEVGSAITPAMFVEGREAMQAAVATGMGVGFIFDSEVGEDPRVRTVSIGHGDIQSVEKIICLKAQARRRLVQAFLDLVRERQDKSFRSAKPLNR